MSPLQSMAASYAAENTIVLKNWSEVVPLFVFVPLFVPQFVFAKSFTKVPL